MGTPNGTGASRRLRTAGLVLLFLAVVAVVIGLVVAVTRDEQAAATGGLSVSPTHAPTSTSAIPSVVPYPPPVPSRPVGPPPDAAERAPAGHKGPSDKGPSDKGPSRGEVRVYNNGTIRGLAARAARDLTAAGWTVVEVGNYARGAIPTTTVYYQEGTDQSADAQALGAQFMMRVEPRFPGIANAGPGLVVIVTNDYASP
jgi:LytR cell envelope-related transcriptional attenuator